ncbi:MAG: hypothetical protein HQL50_10035 [Magnetococcales bacterium]|nr:hypothetical protein [Magnetococcales bacterium]
MDRNTSGGYAGTMQVAARFAMSCVVPSMWERIIPHSGEQIMMGTESSRRHRNPLRLMVGIVALILCGTAPTAADESVSGGAVWTPGLGSPAAENSPYWPLLPLDAVGLRQPLKNLSPGEDPARLIRPVQIEENALDAGESDNGASSRWPPKLGAWLLEQGADSQALAMADRALERGGAPLIAQAWLRIRARAEARLARFQQADATLAMFPQHRFSEDPELILLAADVGLGLGNCPDALVHYGRFLSLFPQRQERFQARLGQAICALTTGKVETADLQLRLYAADAGAPDPGPLLRLAEAERSRRWGDVAGVETGLQQLANENAATTVMRLPGGMGTVARRLWSGLLADRQRWSALEALWFGWLEHAPKPLRAALVREWAALIRQWSNPTSPQFEKGASDTLLSFQILRNRASEADARHTAFRMLWSWAGDHAETLTLTGGPLTPSGLALNPVELPDTLRVAFAEGFLRAGRHLESWEMIAFLEGEAADRLRLALLAAGAGGGERLRGVLERLTTSGNSDWHETAVAAIYGFTLKERFPEAEAVRKALGSVTTPRHLCALSMHAPFTLWKSGRGHEALWSVMDEIRRRHAAEEKPLGTCLPEYIRIWVEALLRQRHSAWILPLFNDTPPPSPAPTPAPSALKPEERTTPAAKPTPAPTSDTTKSATPVIESADEDPTLILERRLDDSRLSETTESAETPAESTTPTTTSSDKQPTQEESLSPAPDATEPEQKAPSAPDATEPEQKAPSSPKPEESSSSTPPVEEKSSADGASPTETATAPAESTPPHPTTPSVTEEKEAESAPSEAPVAPAADASTLPTPESSVETARETAADPSAEPAREAVVEPSVDASPPVESPASSTDEPSTPQASQSKEPTTTETAPREQPIPHSDIAPPTNTTPTGSASETDAEPVSPDSENDAKSPPPELSDALPLPEPRIQLEKGPDTTAVESALEKAAKPAPPAVFQQISDSEPLEPAMKSEAINTETETTKTESSDEATADER